MIQLKKIGGMFCILLPALFFSCKKQPVTDRIVLNLADVHPQDYPTVIGCQEFGALVYARTNGHIVINVQTNVESEKEIVERVRSGKLDFGRVSGTLLADFSPSFRVLSTPYLFRDSNHFWTTLNSAIGKQILASLMQAGFVGLCYYESGARSFYFTKPLGNYEEFAGLKIRVQNNADMVAFVRDLGAVPYPIEYADVYPALTNGAVVGAENNIPSYWSAKHYQIARYYLLDEHTRVPDVLMCSERTFMQLSPQDRELLQKAATDSVLVQRVAWEEYERTATRAISKGGTVFHAFDYDKSARKIEQALENRTAHFNEAQRYLMNEIRSIK